MSTNCGECSRGKTGLEHRAHKVRLKDLSLLSHKRGLQKQSLILLRNAELKHKMWWSQDKIWEMQRQQC